MSATPLVTRYADLHGPAVTTLLARYGIALCQVADGAPIPASYWGAPEAGVIGCSLQVRSDTPMHSILHTACHIICMDGQRRAALHTDCGGSDEEECAVCYLQVLLADALPGYGRQRLWADMDAWGYSFRLGGARQWFEADALDARDWLLREGLIDAGLRPLWRLRDQPTASSR